MRLFAQIKLNVWSCLCVGFWRWRKSLVADGCIDFVDDETHVENMGLNTKQLI